MNAISTTAPAQGAASLPVSFTLFTGRKRLTKFLHVVDGVLAKEPPANAGTGRTDQVDMDLADLPCFLAGLTTNQCLVTGVCDRTTANITPVEYPVPGAINRTKEFFHYPNGPALVMLDHDPDKERPGMIPAELLAVLADISPVFAAAARVVKLSTSAEVYAPDGRLLSTPTPGFHVYFAVADGQDIPRFGKALFRRLWLAGRGWGRLGKTGSFLLRGAIDAAVFSPERCIFEAGAALGEGLEQRLGAAEFTPGGVLDTSLLPDLSEAEEAEYQRLVDEERGRLKPHQEPARRVYAAGKAAETGEDADRIYNRLADAEKGVIDCSATIMVAAQRRLWLPVRDTAEW